MIWKTVLLCVVLVAVLCGVASVGVGKGVRAGGPTVAASTLTDTRWLLELTTRPSGVVDALDPADDLWIEWYFASGSSLATVSFFGEGVLFHTDVLKFEYTGGVLILENLDGSNYLTANVQLDTPAYGQMTWARVGPPSTYDFAGDAPGIQQLDASGNVVASYPIAPYSVSDPVSYQFLAQ